MSSSALTCSNIRRTTTRKSSQVVSLRRTLPDCPFGPVCSQLGRCILVDMQTEWTSVRIVSRPSHRTRLSSQCRQRFRKRSCSMKTRCGYRVLSVKAVADERLSSSVPSRHCSTADADKGSIRVNDGTCVTGILRWNACSAAQARLRVRDAGPVVRKGKCCTHAHMHTQQSLYARSGLESVYREAQEPAEYLQTDAAAGIVSVQGDIVTR